MKEGDTHGIVECFLPWMTTLPLEEMSDGGTRDHKNGQPEQPSTHRQLHVLEAKPAHSVELSHFAKGRRTEAEARASDDRNGVRSGACAGKPAIAERAVNDRQSESLPPRIFEALDRWRDDGVGLPVEGLNERVEPTTFRHAVCIQEDQNPAASLYRSPISRGGDAATLLTYDRHAIVAGPNERLATTVARPIVNDDDLVGHRRRVPNGFDRPPEPAPLVMGRYDHRDIGPHAVHLRHR